MQKEIRSSLVLSMLQQMLAEDKADMVREAVVKSLGIIMGYIDDPDKYSQGFELMLLSLGDPSERVVSATHQVFIPAFAAWCTELGNLQAQLIPSLLTRIEKLLKGKPSVSRASPDGALVWSGPYICACALHRRTHVRDVYHPPGQ
ncbi:lisH domain and HEAT repeat-containing KIAA1468 -like protein [Labeo rohita]|uniref:LisH domain and HEAT repeat-containing KIAA1468-like protein n=1 Tax=Labeo rohita TaxID=84645 RepID=A0A498P2H0_LABRO|nr:lisH domain and HEAT repeat-containing KIAA1468 -like protein [Labeo rohita]